MALKNLFCTVAHTAFQYPFALNLEDCKDKQPWAMALLDAIVELSSVAGGHARSYFEMAPRSIVARLTGSLVAGFRETTYLTTNIDRDDASRTEAPRFAPGEHGPCPSGAWVRVGPICDASGS